MVSCMEIKVKTVPFTPFLYDNLSFITPIPIKSFLGLKRFNNVSLSRSLGGGGGHLYAYKTGRG